MRFPRFVVSLVLLTLTGCWPDTGDRAISAGYPSAACAPASSRHDAGAMAAPVPADLPLLRLVTFNIHSGLGPTFALAQSAARVREHLLGVAEAIAAAAPEVDIVGLNEVDLAARRSGGFDQARYLARALGALTGQRYQVVYGETWRRRTRGFEVRFGNAALVRRPLLAQATCPYDALEHCASTSAAGFTPRPPRSVVDRVLAEPRGLIKLTVDLDGRPVDVIVTHLDALSLRAREVQAALLLHRVVDPARTTAVLGDFNAVPTSMTVTRPFFAADRTYDLLTGGPLSDARIGLGTRGTGAQTLATYPAASPVWPLDGVLGSLDLVPRDVRVVETSHSDHHGLYVEYGLTRDARVIARRRARHDAQRRRQLARLFACDLNRLQGARLYRLLAGSGYLEVASAVQRRTLQLFASRTAVAEATH